MSMLHAALKVAGYAAATGMGFSTGAYKASTSKLRKEYRKDGFGDLSDDIMLIQNTKIMKGDTSGYRPFVRNGEDVPADVQADTSDDVKADVDVKVDPVTEPVEDAKSEAKSQPRRVNKPKEGKA